MSEMRDMCLEGELFYRNDGRNYMACCIAMENGNGEEPELEHLHR
jgi:hypothetical protein